MEGITVFEGSLKELKRVRKQLGSSKITINMDTLDETSKNEVISALSQIISKRESQILAMYAGAPNF